MTKPEITIATECRVCGNKNLQDILSLGDLFISDFVDTADEGVRAPLELVLCNEADGGCGLLQMKHTVSHESLYRNYWYRSGMNQTMKDELASITASVKEIAALKSGDHVIDIGSNDGTTLRSYGIEGLKTVGFEPATNIVEKYGTEGITKVINNFFNFEEWQKTFGALKAKAVTAIAMFYDLEHPNTFVADLAKVLDPEGLLIIQMAYVPLALERNAFDGICHEHLELYSLLSLENLLKRHDLEVVDVTLRDINEGSFRAYIRHKGAGATLKLQVGAAERVAEMRAKEKKLGLDGKQVYVDFVKRVEAIRDKTREFIAQAVKSGKSVYVYGASTKGNTLLQYFGLDHNLITAAAERNPDKWGKHTVGTMIPIISEQQAREAKADYFFVLPWHFMKEFHEREKEYLAAGGKFIVPLPEMRIIES